MEECRCLIGVTRSVIATMREKNSGLDDLRLVDWTENPLSPVV